MPGTNALAYFDSVLVCLLAAQLSALFSTFSPSWGQSYKTFLLVDAPRYDDKLECSQLEKPLPTFLVGEVCAQNLAERFILPRNAPAKVLSK